MATTTEPEPEPAPAPDARNSTALAELPSTPDDVREAVLALHASQQACVNDAERPADLNAHGLLPLSSARLEVETLQLRYTLNAICVLLPMLEVPVATPRLYVLLMGAGAPWPTCGAVWLMRQYALATRALVKSGEVYARADHDAPQCHEQVLKERQRECKQLREGLLVRLAELHADTIDSDDRYHALLDEMHTFAVGFLRSYERAIMRLCHEACRHPSIPEHYREALHVQRDERPPVTSELSVVLAKQRRWVTDVRRRFFTYRKDADDGASAMDSLALAPPPPGMPTRAEIRSFARFLGHEASSPAVVDVQQAALARFLQKDDRAAAAAAADADAANSGDDDDTTITTTAPPTDTTSS